MMKTTDKSSPLKIALFFVIALSLSAGTSYAGLTDTGTPYFDGVDTWVGVTPFDNGTGVSGTVEWAVFGPGDFPFSGFSPPADELTYAYQVFSTGTEDLSSYSLTVTQPAGNEGSFSDAGNGVTGTGASVSGSFDWTFDTAISTGGNSEGLVFTSPNTPEDFFAIVVDGGTFALVLPVPVPSDTEIPEPSTLVLACACVLGFAASRRRRLVR